MPANDHLTKVHKDALRQPAEGSDSHCRPKFDGAHVECQDSEHLTPGVKGDNAPAAAARTCAGDHEGHEVAPGVRKRASRTLGASRRLAEVQTPVTGDHAKLTE